MTLKLDRSVTESIHRSAMLTVLRSEEYGADCIVARHCCAEIRASPDGREFLLSIEDCALRECDGMCFMAHIQTDIMTS